MTDDQLQAARRARASATTESDERDEYLVKLWGLLSGPSQRYDGMPVGSTASGRRPVGPEHVHAMLVGLDRRSYLAGMLLQAGDYMALRPLVKCLWGATMKRSIKEKWDLPHGPGKVYALGPLAIWELAGPGRGCAACEGEGSIPHPETTTRLSCENCEGRGKLPLSERERADWIEVGKHAWHRIWSWRYAEVLTDLMAWRTAANDHMDLYSRG